MNPKHIWGVIIIVVGVLFVLGGLSGLYHISVFEEDIIAMSRMGTELMGHDYAASFGMDTASLENEFHAHKLACFASILIGILLSIIGTLMVSEKKTNSPAEFSAMEKAYINARFQMDAENIEDEADLPSFKF